MRNVMKADQKKGKRPLEEAETTTTPKRKKGDVLIRRYPIIPNNAARADNPETIEQHMKAITAELGKSKPRDTVLLPLLRLTYEVRRMFVLDEMNTVNEILEKYPGLSRLAIVSN